MKGGKSGHRKKKRSRTLIKILMFVNHTLSINRRASGNDIYFSGFPTVRFTIAGSGSA